MGWAIAFRRGVTLVEMLVSLVMGSLVLLVVFQQLGALGTGHKMTADSNLANAQTSQSLDTIADHLRAASACSNSAAGTLDSAIDAATATSVTYYGDSACAKVTYALTGGNLCRTDSGVTTIVVRNVTSLTFSYFKATTYNTAWTSTTSPSAPTAAELPFVCGIQIDVVSSSNGVSNRMSTTVRLRNAPKKTNLSGL